MPLSSRFAGVLMLAVSTAAGAQERRQLSADNPQAQLMGYYAAVMQFTPTGLHDPAARLELGAEATYIPSLSERDRLVGFGGTKQEDTNFCPVFPRLRGSRAAGSWVVELGYVPPVRACGVRPHMISGALLRRIPVSSRWGAVVRASAHYGTLDAAITCGESAIADPADQTCFGGLKSDDRVRPLALALDGAFAFAGWRARRLEPYAMIGVRREDVRFDVHFVNSANVLDDERLGARLTRLHAAVGAAWGPTSEIRLGAELYYAPGALLTLRTRAGYALRAHR
ncbi:MAG: hypothetical protein HY705_00355 [Gemmatimonadetes bacterium]|nr:hypothetical protein [Gemmatimonadota bacterium]